MAWRWAEPAEETMLTPLDSPAQPEGWSGPAPHTAVNGQDYLKWTRPIQARKGFCRRLDGDADYVD
ncbi:hypothetical protein KQX64_06905 [Rhodopseudomonas palustris]|nr:hypothetical protein KQX64_06905 [Rhodopseudomonas palustris]